MTNDPYWNSVVLAMHMDDTGLTDLKGHAVTLVGNTVRSATQSKFGGYSAYFDGSGDSLEVVNSADFAFGGADFTIEAWIYPTNTNNVAQDIAFFGNDGNNTDCWLFRFWGGAVTGSVNGAIYQGATAGNFPLQGGVIMNAWNHVAMVRTAGVASMFVNGVRGSTAAITLTQGTPVGTNPGLAVAREYHAASGTAYFKGYIDDLRITKGVARYTANFTPSTDPFPNTKLQLSGTVKDANGNLVARAVRAYRRSDGLLSGATTSSASDGTFVVDGYDDSPHYVVCLDDDDLNENALILDNITPV